MRLTDTERSAIIEVTKNKDPQAQIWLFGSRVDDNAKGGDIDLIVISNIISFSERIDVLVDLKARVGDQRIDLRVVRYNDMASDPLAASVLPRAIRLA